MILELVVTHLLSPLWSNPLTFEDIMGVVASDSSDEELSDLIKPLILKVESICEFGKALLITLQLSWLECPRVILRTSD